MIRMPLVVALATALIAAGSASGRAPEGVPNAVRSPQGAFAVEAARQAPLFEQRVIAVINRVRRDIGLAPLRFNPQLAEAAREHSLSMAEQGYFEHSSATGSPFWDRLEAKYRPGAAHRWSVGENLAWGSPSLSARQVVALWLRSHAHRRILLNPRWRDIGVGSVHASAAPGVYEGLPAMIVTADFGVRA